MLIKIRKYLFESRFIFAILFLALILRVLFIWQRYLGNDEPFTLDWISNGLSHFIAVKAIDGSPPLFYFLALISNTFFGLYGVYALVIFFGVCTIFVLYKIADLLFGRRVALLSALLITISPMHVLYSQHLRPYSFIQFLVLLGVYFALRFLFINKKHDANRNRNLLWLSVLLVLAVLTYYPAIACFVLIYAYLVFDAFKNKKSPSLEIISIIPGVLTFFVLQYLFSGQFSRAVGSYYYPLLEDFFYFFYKNFAAINISTALTVIPYALLFGGLLMILFFTGLIISRNTKHAKLLFFVIFGSILAYYLAYPFVNQILYFKHMSSMAPLLFIFPAIALFKIENKNSISFYGILIILVLLSALLLSFYYSTIISVENWIPIIGH